MEEQQERLMHAMTALSAYHDAKGDVCDPGQLAEEEVADLVADLHHLASSRRLDWGRVTKLASLHYQAEAGEFARRETTRGAAGRVSRRG